MEFFNLVLELKLTPEEKHNLVEFMRQLRFSCGLRSQYSLRSPQGHLQFPVLFLGNSERLSTPTSRQMTATLSKRLLLQRSSLSRHLHGRFGRISFCDLGHVRSSATVGVMRT